MADPFCESRSSTQFKVVKLRHSWTVHNLSHSWKKNGEKCISPAFSAGKNRWNDKSEWCLWLYPKGECKESNKFVSLFLVLNTCHVSEIPAKFKLRIVNAAGSVIKEPQELSHLFTKKEPNYCFTNFQIPCNNLYNDKLIISCEITITLGSDNNSPEILTTPQSDLPNDFDFLLENSELSDIILAAGGKEFPAHRVILAARSPVFRAMFQHDMAETRKNRVEIADLDEESLSEMLRYMYTGEIHKLDQMAPRLLEVAEKYSMDALKITCGKALVESLSVENAAETLILSDTFHATELKNEVKKFIVVHATEVGNTDGFESMLRTHTHLGVEAFCVLSNPSIVS